MTQKEVKRISVRKENYKAQTETVAVAILIIVMAVFFVLYLISLPPAERQRLLNVTASFAAFTFTSNFLKYKK